MITREQRKEIFSFCARQRDCVVCSAWPRAEKAARRLEIDDFPTKGICVRCWLAFFKGFCVVTDSLEEPEAWIEAARQSDANHQQAAQFGRA
jgi:hypothetical protein